MLFWSQLCKLADVWGVLYSTDVNYINQNCLDHYDDECEDDDGDDYNNGDDDNNSGGAGVGDDEDCSTHAVLW